MDKIFININKNGIILVWNDEDVLKLREKCRIFGKFIGMTARCYTKGNFNGLPLKLGYDELATLLTEYSQDITLFLTKSIISVEKPNQKCLDKLAEDLGKNYNENLKIITKETEEKVRLHFQNDLRSRKRKLDHTGNLLPSKLPKLDQGNTETHQPYATPDYWVRKGEKIRLDIPTIISLADAIHFLESLDVDFIEDTCRRKRILTSSAYHYLWKHGVGQQDNLCITRHAKKMGGDYLIYPQDPWICHADHVIWLISNSEAEKVDLIGRSRLVNSLKKTLWLLKYQDIKDFPFISSINALESQNLIDSLQFSMIMVTRKTDDDDYDDKCDDYFD